MSHVHVSVLLCVCVSVRFLFKNDCFLFVINTWLLFVVNCQDNNQTEKNLATKYSDKANIYETLFECGETSPTLGWFSPTLGCFSPTLRWFSPTLRWFLRMITKSIKVLFLITYHNMTCLTWIYKKNTRYTPLHVWSNLPVLDRFRCQVFSLQGHQAFGRQCPTQHLRFKDGIRKPGTEGGRISWCWDRFGWNILFSQMYCCLCWNYL